MLKKYRTSLLIIRLSKAIGLMILIGFIVLGLASFLMNQAPVITQMSLFFAAFKWWFLIGHGLFYGVFYYAWPRWVVFVAHRKGVTPGCAQLKQAIQARVYLIGALIVFELLMLLR